MNYYKAFYWITRADDIKQSLNVFSNLFLGLGILFSIVYFIFLIDTLSGGTDVNDKSILYRKSMGKLSSVTILLL